MLEVPKEKQAVLVNLIKDILCGIHIEAALGVATVYTRLEG